MSTEQVQRLFAQMMGVIYEQELRIMHEFGLSLLEYYSLQILGFAAEASLKEIGLRLDLPRSTVTFVADSLERKGVVERRRSRKDRRVWLIRLTEPGRRLMEAIYARKAVALLPVLDSLPDVEREALMKLMAGVIRQLQATPGRVERSSQT